MQPQTVTLIVAVMGIAGTLAGGMASQWMTRRAQHKQWLRDQRKQEWRELLNTLTKAFATIIRLEQVGVAYDPDSQLELAAAKESANNVIRDRIFIAPEVGDMNVLRAWTLIMNSSRRGDLNDAQNRFHNLAADIVLSALKTSE
ncbi:hypothetical protein [Terriglobus roseus]|uniref:Protein kilB n=1 Tax=Terriglobus roseus TaxID=392734 RepID=A0A1H4J2H8_9BACT|nr:hypothetical protein [Terriglobus roseus]SEB40427.1 hypothetical protein SAMN05443244_0308 [Terriglobus roseus]